MRSIANSLYSRENASMRKQTLDERAEMRDLGFAALQALHGVLGGASEGSEGELRGGGRLEFVDEVFKEVSDDEVVVLVV